jgi:hypothetical protein
MLVSGGLTTFINTLFLTLLGFASKKKDVALEGGYPKDLGCFWNICVTMISKEIRFKERWQKSGPKPYEFERFLRIRCYEC